MPLARALARAVDEEGRALATNERIYPKLANFEPNGQTTTKQDLLKHWPGLAAQHRFDANIKSPTLSMTRTAIKSRRNGAPEARTQSGRATGVGLVGDTTNWAAMGSSRSMNLRQDAKDMGR